MNSVGRITNDKVHAQVGNAMNEGNGTFTSPADGRYFFAFHASKRSIHVVFSVVNDCTVDRSFSTVVSLKRGDLLVWRCNSATGKKQCLHQEYKIIF